MVDKFWNRLASWSRRRTRFYCLLVREAAPNGKDFGIGEHFHALVHVPRRQFSSLKIAVASWHPEPGEAFVEPADHTIRWTQQRKIRSSLGYLTKQRSTRAWYLTNYTRKPGGKVLGKRFRISANLRAKPITLVVPRSKAYSSRSGRLQGRFFVLLNQDIALADTNSSGTVSSSGWVNVSWQ
jgi:hypothetical protein